MSSQDLAELINEIKKIGEEEKISEKFSFSAKKVEDSGINREHWSFWEDQCSLLSLDEMVHLFKGLVIVERELELSGGSVAGNIWVLKQIKERLSDSSSAEIVKWARSARGRNPYTPLGRMT